MSKNYKALMRLRIPILISLSALMLSGSRVAAQLLPADEFFHGGARSYLTNNIGGALQWVTNGLAAYPHDEKLKKLEELLKQQQQQQQNQDQQSDSKQDQQKNQKQDQQQKPQDQKQEDKDKQKSEKPEDKKDQKSAEQKQAQKPEEAKEQKPEEEGKAGEMTPQEAKQLLDAQKNDEMMMPVSRKEKPVTQRRSLKDW